MVEVVKKIRNKGQKWVANADSAPDAYIHGAIDQAFRAVKELS